MTTAEGEMANWIEDDWHDVRLSRKREVKEKKKEKKERWGRINASTEKKQNGVVARASASAGSVPVTPI